MQNILVIDDEVDVRDAIGRVLERAGYRVRTAESALEGITAMEALEPDVVVTDIIMPKINGVEAISMIRQKFPQVRIVAISGGGNFGITAYQPNAITTSAYLAAAQKAGANLILTKPFESWDLLEAIQNVALVGHA